MQCTSLQIYIPHVHCPSADYLPITAHARVLYLLLNSTSTDPDMVSDSSIAQFAVAWCLPESLFATDRYAPLIGHSEVLVELLSVLVQTQRQQGAQSVMQRETGEVLAFILLQLPLETQQTHLLLCGLNKRRRSQTYDHKRNISASKHAEFTFQTIIRETVNVQACLSFTLYRSPW